VVSHDRYFMDKIVDHLFVFRGGGIIEDFPGNYTDFRVYEDSKPKIESTTTKKTISKEKTITKAKLSFKEQKEYKNLEGEIEQLETQKEIIEKLFASNKIPSEEINKKSIELQEIITKIGEKEERWFELLAKLEI